MTPKLRSMTVYVNKCRNGKIAEVRECRTKEEALEAVGLRE